MRDDFSATRWRTAAHYLRRRRVVFAVAYLGYAACYLVRNNVAVASDILTREHGWTPAQIGSILAGFTLSYGIGKLVMGVVVDRYSLRHSFAWGLGVSALVCVGMTFLTDPLALTLALVLIGVLQGACAPAALATLGAWYPARQRGSRVAIWNTSQNLGGAGLPLVVSGGLALTGPTNWQIAFWLPGCIALIAALAADRLGGERPWQEGLPTLRELAPDAPGELPDPPPSDVGYWDLVRVHVLANPSLALLMVLNALLYVLRFGILNWIPIFLIGERGHTQFQAAATMSLFEWGAIPGALAFAVVAWRWPRGTSTAAAWCMVALAVLIPVYAAGGAGGAGSVVPVGAVAFALGALVYGPQVIVNILTLAFVSPRAVGVAVGWVGLGGYLVGALSANLAIPQLAGAAGWPVSFAGLTLVALTCAVLCRRLQRLERR